MSVKQGLAQYFASVAESSKNNNTSNFAEEKQEVR
jgi:hypothetical protein